MKNHGFFTRNFVPVAQSLQALMKGMVIDMADFDSLVKKYKNFQAPAIKIKVDGNEIQTTLKVGIPSASIKLSLENASSVDFTVVNVYDLKSSKYDINVKAKIKLGAVITVELGYESDLKEVFKGFISNLSYDFSDVPSIKVTAHDARRLMMQNIRCGLKFKEKKYSDVAKTVLGAYKKLCSKLEITATTAEIDNIMQKGTDFKFLKDDIGKKANREFFIVGDTAYFRDYSEENEVILTLERGKGLISFSSSATYCNEEIIVYGGRDKENKDIKVKDVAKTYSQTPSLVTPGLVHEIQNSECNDQDKATQVLNNAIDERLQASQGGSGSCIGLPEIEPGKCIKIDKLDALVNKTYYINQVTHTYGDGYTTEFEVGGWK